ncbi:MAG: radical SAM protein [Ruminococcaceae bacterium]|nr:radical SAM protein [Oscillospiraceae bacterium]
MNKSKLSPKTTQDGCLVSKEKSETFAYRVNDSIYLNITNRCTNDCVFCLRNNSSAAYGSDPLWLKREPSPDEVINAVKRIYFDECDCFVFCGYGEPTCRFDVLIETAKLLKESYNLPIRLNTNGQSELINSPESTKLLFGLIDRVSISLNSANAEDYDSLCKPVFGLQAYDSLLKFGENCVGNIPDVIFSVVEETLSDDDIDKCREIVNKIGAKLRVRKFISENDKNPEGK